MVSLDLQAQFFLENLCVNHALYFLGLVLGDGFPTRNSPLFKAIEHEADVAFHIYGETLSDLNLHAQIALSFECPGLTLFLYPQSKPKTLEEIIIGLNEIVTRADREIGMPFKAVSFHGEIKKEHEETLKWEMIVEV